MKSLEFEYECGEFVTSSEKKVSFIRVSNFTDVLTQTVEELKQSRHLISHSNIPDNVLWTLFTGDKGGKSTKLLLQILNCKEQHSVHCARLLAIFEGDKDSYECLEKVFKPIIDEAIQVLSDLPALNIHVQLPKSNRKPQNQTDITENINVKGTENWPNELTRMNPGNVHFSENCFLCKKQVSLAVKIPKNERETIEIDHTYSKIKEASTSGPTPTSEATDVCLSQCWISLGGDWEFLARFLGLTGPNGTCFCNFCHVQLKDVPRGKPHTPSTLPKYSQSCEQFTVRTFESISSDNRRFVDAGANKAKVNKFHNCELPPIFKTAGPVIDSVSCMPLHLSLGLGKQALELVEKEAIFLDNAIKEKNGKASQKLTTELETRASLEEECSEVEKELDVLKNAASCSQEKLNDFLQKSEAYLQKEGRRYTS